LEGAGQLCLLDDVGLCRRQYIGIARRRAEIKLGAADRQQAKIIMMDAAAGWRAGTAVTLVAEIVAPLEKPEGRASGAIPGGEPRGCGRNVKHGQCWNRPDGASGSSTTKTRLRVPGGTPDQLKGGEMSAPLQVYSGGIGPPDVNARLASINGIGLLLVCLGQTLSIQPALGRVIWRGKRR